MFHTRFAAAAALMMVSGVRATTEYVKVNMYPCSDVTTSAIDFKIALDDPSKVYDCSKADYLEYTVNFTTGVEILGDHSSYYYYNQTQNGTGTPINNESGYMCGKDNTITEWIEGCPYAKGSKISWKLKTPSSHVCGYDAKMNSRVLLYEHWPDKIYACFMFTQWEVPKPSTYLRGSK